MIMKLRVNTHRSEQTLRARCAIRRTDQWSDTTYIHTTALTIGHHSGNDCLAHGRILYQIFCENTRYCENVQRTGGRRGTRSVPLCFFKPDNGRNVAAWYANRPALLLQAGQREKRGGVVCEASRFASLSRARAGRTYRRGHGEFLALRPKF